MVRCRSLYSLCCLVTACSADMVTVADAITVGDATTEGPASDLPMLDLPASPECPAGLGEVVACDCAVVEGCTVPNAEPETGCMFECEVASPCPVVACAFNSSVSWPTCEADLDVAALECVFDALAEDQPFAWTTRRYDTYPFASDSSWREFQRLDPTTYVVFDEHHFGNDVGDGGSEYSYAALEIPESKWLACDALADDYERFNCLHGLAFAAEPCANPSALICPAP